MALSPYILWINTEDGTLTAGSGLERSAASPFFIQGDTAQIELHFLKRLDGVLTETAIDAGGSVRVGVGEREARPTAGTFILSYGGDSTGDIAYNASASTIQTALNALASVTADGGLTVEAIGDGFLINWNTGTNHTDITANTEALFPKSIAKIVQLSGTTEQTIYLHLAQTPIAFSDNWSEFATAEAYTELIAPFQTSGVAKIVRLGIDGVPSYGYLNLAVYRNNISTTPMGYASLDLGMSSGEMKEAVASVIKDINGVPTPQVLLDVVKVDDYIWDFIFSNDTNIQIGSENIITSKGVFGSLSFNTVECHQFLAGATQKESILEVMIVGATGEQTLLQLPVVIYSDVIDANSLVPLTFDTPLGEATANARFVRRDTAQNPSPTELNNIWLNLGVTKLGADIAGALSNANTPTSGNPLATLNDLLGLDPNWGSIGGTLSDQTDLKNALDLKAPLANPSFTGDATVAGRVGIGGGVAINPAHKLAIYDGSIVFSAGYGLAFGDGTTQTTAFPGFAGYFNLTANNQTITGQNTFTSPQTFRNVPRFEQGTNAALNLRRTGIFEPSVLADGDVFLWGQNLAYRRSGETKFVAHQGDFVGVGGGSFTGKVNFTSVNGTAGLNIGIGGTDTASTTAGDMWIAPSGSALNYRDGLGSWRILATRNLSNTFTVPQIVQTPAGTISAALRVTQLGTGNALVVEDGSSQNPDTDAFVIDASGNVGVGVNSSTFTATSKVEVVGNVKADTFSNSSGPTFSIDSTASHTSGSSTLDAIVTIGGVQYRIALRPA